MGKSKQSRKIRVNITVDRNNLEKAKKKLVLFGGKLSTLFNAYLSDFVSSMEKEVSQKSVSSRLKELEKRVKKLEGRNSP